MTLKPAHPAPPTVLISDPKRVFPRAFQSASEHIISSHATKQCLIQPLFSSQVRHLEMVIRQSGGYCELTQTLGANSGIGYATTKVIASQPNHHVIMACRDTRKGEQAQSEIQSSGIRGTLSLQQLDVSDDASIAAAVETISKVFGRIDVLISNAGITAPEAPNGRGKLRAIFETNVFGAMLLAEAFVPLLLKSSKPYLIQVSSLVGSLGLATDPKDPFYATEWDEYRMSKSALNMLTVQLHKKLQDRNIKVFSFCPGLVRSNLRGTTEEAVSAGGAAGDPIESGKGIMDILEGNRDAETGRFVHKDGVWPW